MQQVRPNREPIPNIPGRGRLDVPNFVRNDISKLITDYAHSQRRYNDRMETLEREMASLKGQVDEAFTQPAEHELNQTFTIKKEPMIPPTSARVASPSRIPVPVTARKKTADDMTSTPVNDNGSQRSMHTIPVTRSKTFHNGTSQQTSNVTEEQNILRSYRAHLEQVLAKDTPSYSDIKIPNYTCFEDVIKANESLLVENDRLRSELNRLKTESILLLRSMKSATGGEPNLGNERITAERERQELSMELARQVEENKRLRKSLLAQSTKFLTLRQTKQTTDAPFSISNDPRRTPVSAPQSVPNSSRMPNSNFARNAMTNRAFARAKTFYHSPHDPM